MTSPGDELVARYTTLPPDEQRATAAKITELSAGLFDLDRRTRRMIWIAVFGVFFLVAIGAFVVILASWNADIITTTGEGATKTTSTTHPDVTAAYAIISAIVAGIVGLLVPSPNKANAA